MKKAEFIVAMKDYAKKYRPLTAQAMSTQDL